MAAQDSSKASSTGDSVLGQSVAILGAGVAGLINAYVLLQDGFTDITVISRDRSVGGTWCRDRVYPGLCINNVHGEYRFSPLEMPVPEKSEETGGRITGLDMCNYMETFYDKFLRDKVIFRFETEILNVRREQQESWIVTIEGIESGQTESLPFSRVVLCTGGCSNPQIPANLSVDAAERAHYRGIVIHSSQLKARLNDILSLVKAKNTEVTKDVDTVVIVGGGKSAMDICAKLANEGRRVVNVFDSSDSFLASTSPLPDFIRKGRFLSLLSPHRELRTYTERFLHTTSIGAAITRFIWRKLQESSFSAYSIPKDSPLRKAHSIFWGVRTNDEGGVRATSYYSLVNSGKIEIIAPARAIGYDDDGRSLRLSTGSSISAQVVVLATGWKSSWTKLFDAQTITELGIGRHAPSIDLKAASQAWNYKTLPQTHAENGGEEWVTSIYRGLVPAKNINSRDFAIAGAMFSANNGYTSELAAHWISSYFQGDPMRLPKTPEAAVAEAETQAAWKRKRYPDMLSWVNESHSATLDFWTWPQAADELLEDLYLPSMRSGRSWFTWPFQVIDLKELSTLKEERKAKREQGSY